MTLQAPIPPAAGVRPAWADIPKRVRVAIEGWLGIIATIDRQLGGRSLVRPRAVCPKTVPNDAAGELAAADRFEATRFVEAEGVFVCFGDERQAIGPAEGVRQGTAAVATALVVRGDGQIRDLHRQMDPLQGVDRDELFIYGQTVDRGVRVGLGRFHTFVAGGDGALTGGSRENRGGRGFRRLIGTELLEPGRRHDHG